MGIRCLISRTLLTGTVLLGLAGCPSLVSELPPSLERATTLAQRGDYAAAAREYEALAKQSPGEAGNGMWLAAAREWLALDRAEDALRALASLSGRLDEAQQFERTMLEIEADLARRQAQQAWSRLGSIADPAAPAQALRVLRLRQRAAFATSRPADGVRAQLAAEPLMADEATRLASRRALLADLRDASERGVKLEPLAAGDPIVRGWLELGPISAQAMRGNVAPALTSWRSRYADHPATELTRSEFVSTAPSQRLDSEPHIALLLPASGRMATAAAQVRDGILAGQYSIPAASRPLLRFYDTSAISVADAITQARDSGADLIVGPLTREDVSSAAQYPAFRPAILALNFLPSGTVAPADFFQFALSPEDEARQVARRLLRTGKRRGAALTPRGDWGTRVLAAFRSELEAGGGTLQTSVEYVPGQNDYSAPIQQALRITDSRARHRRLETLLGTKLAFQPRRRADIDFLFCPAPAATARQFRPQLRFHSASDIPAYATSDSFEPGLAANKDLDGLIFPEMPWVLGNSERVAQVRSATRLAWGDAAAPRAKLFAFGFDAWQLAVALRSEAARSTALEVEGLTGLLSLGPERRIRRDLSWAQIRGGGAQPID